MALSAVAFSACATTSTKKVALAPAEIEAEEVRQREIVLAEHQEHQQRLSDLAWPILEAARPLCRDDVGFRAGFQFANAWSYPDKWREAAKRIGLGDTLQVTVVGRGTPADRAGLRVGDRLLSVEGDPVPVGDDAAEALSEALEARLQDARPHRVTLVVRRGDAEHDLGIEPEQMCAYPVLLEPSTTLNAFADGGRIYVTAAMMRFTTDQELSVILAHELAHNAMGHIDAKRQNALLGAILGAVADLAISAGGGYNTGGAYAAQGAQAGGGAFSQDFESEADYVGLYALALAGIELDGAPNLWRHMALADPGSIGFAGTHPTTVERFLRMERTIEEIERKRAEGRPLRPDPKDEGGD